MFGAASLSFANESKADENTQPVNSVDNSVYWEIDIDCGNGVTGNACCYSTFDEAVDDLGNAVLAICGEDVYEEMFPT